jgi:hypothetical protein
VHIDRKSLRDSRWWIAISLALLLACSIWFIIYRHPDPQRTSGGSLPGLVFGSVGTAIVLFAWALTIRKWRRSAPWGRTYHWLQGHVYLSIVSYPIIFYHAGGLRFGGTLTTVLMWAFTVCYFSGLIVLILQQVLPRLMRQEIPLETIYDQIDDVARTNLATADDLVAMNAPAVALAATVPAGAAEAEYAAAAIAAEAGRPSPAAAAELKTFYERRVRPYLAHGLSTDGQTHAAAVKPPAGDEFSRVRKILPDALRSVVDTLQTFTEERRQFALQRRMQHLLHGWLLLHVPAAWVMIILIPIHAVMAIRYL